MTNHSVLLAALATLASCGDDTSGNADVLWIAPDGVETRLKLVEARPSPF